MTVNLRRALLVFEVGFGAESAGGFVALAGGAAALPFHGVLLLLGPVFSAFGILLLYVGRHEWNEVHRTRVRYASTAFAANLLAIALAAAPVAWLTYAGDTDPTGLGTVLFGVAVGLVFSLTFVTYALVAAHLVGRLGEVAMALGLGWAAVVSGLIALALAPQLHPLVHDLLARSFALGTRLQPISLLDALLAFSYLAFLVGFADAHRRVVRGLDPAEAGALLLGT